MGEQSAHEPVCFLTELCISVRIIKYRLAILEQEHVHMHSIPCFPGQGLRHECGGAAIQYGFILDHVFCRHRIIRKLKHITELYLYLHLSAAADLGVMVFNINSPLTHGKAHT